eukprot:5874547-Pyramimonas_sp.AAC.1
MRPRTRLTASSTIRPTWRARAKDASTRIVVLGLQGPRWRRLAAKQMTDAHAFYPSKHRVCHQPPDTRGQRTARLIVLTCTPAPSYASAASSWKST